MSRLAKLDFLLEFLASSKKAQRNSVVLHTLSICRRPSCSYLSVCAVFCGIHNFGIQSSSAFSMYTSIFSFHLQYYVLKFICAYLKIPVHLSLLCMTHQISHYTRDLHKWIERQKHIDQCSTVPDENLELCCRLVCSVFSYGGYSFIKIVC